MKILLVLFCAAPEPLGTPPSRPARWLIDGLPQGCIGAAGCPKSKALFKCKSATAIGHRTAGCPKSNELCNFQFKMCDSYMVWSTRLPKAKESLKNSLSTSDSYKVWGNPVAQSRRLCTNFNLNMRQVWNARLPAVKGSVRISTYMCARYRVLNMCLPKIQRHCAKFNQNVRQL